MSFRDCVERAVRAGLLNRDQAEGLFTQARDFERVYRLDLQHSPESALRLGVEEALKSARRRTRLAKYQAAKQAILNTENVRNVRAHPKGTGTGIASLYGRDLSGRASYSNVDIRGRSIEALAHGRFAEGIAAMRTRLVGLKQDRELIRDVVREAFGTSSGNSRAAGVAKQWAEVAEGLRQRFNRAGGAIPNRADWGMPQSHDTALVARTTMADWIAFTKPRLRREAMTNADGAVLSDGELDLLLQHVYRTISTDGWANMVPGTQGGTKLANRRQDHRVLVFNDGDTWLEYADRFGKPDLFAVMTDHISSMAHDIGLLEVLGPNPAAAHRLLMDVAVKDGVEKTRQQMLESLFRTVNGNVERTASPKVADFFNAVRSWLVAAKLGSAALSAVSDIAFVQKTASWNGLPFMRVAGRMLSQLNPGNEADRILATRMGLSAMSAARSLSTANRFSEIRGGGFAAKAAEVTLRASGLSAWTDAWKRAFGMEMFARLGDQLERGFGDLDEATRRTLSTYGVTPEDWDIIRATAPMAHKGARFVSVENVMTRADLDLRRREQLVAKLQQMVITETHFAIPEPDARVRAVTSGALFGSGARGTWSGEVGRSVFQFKGFAVSALMLHVYRAVNAKGSGTNPMSYAASLLITTTLLGALALQLKEISRGKNPRPMNERRFWGAALTQGGGLGIYGDFLFNDVNRFGGGLTQTMSGPLTALIDDTARISLGNVQELVKGEDMDIGADLVDYARRYTPGGSLWYGRLIFEREVLDQLQLMADPEARTKFRRRMRQRQREYNQSYWWQHGEAKPDEPPQLQELVE